LGGNCVFSCRLPATTASVGGERIGLFPQSQPGLNYIGIALPLGKISSSQLTSLAELAQNFGSGELRLTPWQTIVLPNLLTGDLPNIRAILDRLNLIYTPNHPHSAIVACAGKNSCQSGLTDAQGDAIDLLQQLTGKIHTPLSIHVSGCDKACAHPYASDITLVGTTMETATGETIPAYTVYVHGTDSPLGKLLIPALPAHQVPSQIDRLLAGD
jgi:ferredoxin-nitrite reductase